jgi:hypothetical protein
MNYQRKAIQESEPDPEMAAGRKSKLTQCPKTCSNVPRPVSSLISRCRNVGQTYPVNICGSQRTERAFSRILFGALAQRASVAFPLQEVVPA